MVALNIPASLTFLLSAKINLEMTGSPINLFAAAVLSHTKFANARDTVSHAYRRYRYINSDSL